MNWIYTAYYKNREQFFTFEVELLEIEKVATHKLRLEYGQPLKRPHFHNTSFLETLYANPMATNKVIIPTVIVIIKFDLIT